MGVENVEEKTASNATPRFTQKEWMHAGTRALIIKLSVGDARPMKFKQYTMEKVARTYIQGPRAT